jgi:hypothetical protein
MFPRFQERRALPRAAASYADAPLAQYWDDTRQVGREFKQRILPSYPRDVAWDVYVLFDEQATWETAANHVVSWGHTVEDAADELFARLGRPGS